MTQIPPNMIPSRALGWVKDPHDPRDHDALKVIKAEATTLPPSHSNRALVKIIDQAQLGSCTCNAAVQVLRAAELTEKMNAGMALATAQDIHETPFASRLFLYYLARAYQNEQKEDAGTYIRLVFQTINKYGFPPESAWPYSDATGGARPPFSSMPNAEAFREAYDQRDNVPNESAGLISYSRISVTGAARINAIKAALVDGCLVAFGTTVTEDFCSGVGIDKPIGVPTSSQKVAGGHAMTICGYDGDNFLIANSWGESFGDAGFIQFTSEYLAWSQSDDFWIVKRAPILPKETA